MNRTDLIAKLLANENLTVIQAPVSTASFDIVNRTLRLPQWKEMSGNLLDMLIGHEVGHALYTLEKEYLKPEFKDTPHFHGYLNVIEDVRIEKLMKRKYPGLRKAFNLGYKELNDKDFFGVADSDFKNMILIDKINLYFKAGYNCGVTFNETEKEFVKRAEDTETVADVIQLSKDIYDYSKAELDGKIEELKKMGMDLDDMEFGDGEDAGEAQMMDVEQEADDEAPSEDEQPATSSAAQDEPDHLDGLESKTEKKLRQKIEELSDVDTFYRYIKIPKKNEHNLFVSYKEIIAEVQDSVAQGDANYQNIHCPLFTESDMEEAEKFKASSKKVVNYLLKEFEMRKSASLYKRAKMSKVGSLDMKKLYQYKLNDDIFKQIMVIPEGKNHGMLMLLDWSGSMSPNIQATIEQVVNLAMFCRGAQIPFQVFAFTDHHRKHDDIYSKITQIKAGGDPLVKDDEINVYAKTLKLLELFSSKMSNSEFNYMTNLTLCKHFTWRDGYRLGSTPLNEALAYLYNYIPEFKNKNGVEKMTFITLTDGDGMHMYDNKQLTITRRRDEGKTTVPFLLDETTKKTYELNEVSSQTKSLLQMMKDRYDITLLGFFITRMGNYDLASAFQSHGLELNYLEMADIKKKMRNEGFLSLKNTGRDDLFLIPASKKIEDEKEVAVTAKDSAAKIAREFYKALNTRKTSRVLLNKFIGWVA
jgi:hypothetical protein